jgi:hypothetical protein
VLAADIGVVDVIGAGIDVVGGGADGIGVAVGLPEGAIDWAARGEPGELRCSSRTCP